MTGYALIDDARSDYFAGGCVYPSIDELKKSGRWDKLDKEWKDWYIKGEQCGKNLSAEIRAKFDRLERKFAERSENVSA